MNSLSSGEINALSLTSLTTVLSSGNGKVATKLICYTRSTPSIHQLPVVHPKATFSSDKELQQSNDHIKNLICSKV